LKARKGEKEERKKEKKKKEKKKKQRKKEKKIAEAWRTQGIENILYQIYISRGETKKETPYNICMYI